VQLRTEHLFSPQFDFCFIMKDVVGYVEQEDACCMLKGTDNA